MHFGNKTAILANNDLFTHLQDNYLDDEILFEKLRPEFKSMYGIDSYLHPYLNTMTCMLQVSICIPFSFHRHIGESYFLMLVCFVPSEAKDACCILLETYQLYLATFEPTYHP